MLPLVIRKSSSHMILECSRMTCLALERRRKSLYNREFCSLIDRNVPRGPVLSSLDPPPSADDDRHHQYHRGSWCLLPSSLSVSVHARGGRPPFSKSSPMLWRGGASLATGCGCTVISVFLPTRVVGMIMSEPRECGILLQRHNFLGGPSAVLSSPLKQSSLPTATVAPQPQPQPQTPQQPQPKPQTPLTLTRPSSLKHLPPVRKAHEPPSKGELVMRPNNYIRKSVALDRFRLSKTRRFFQPYARKVGILFLISSILSLHLFFLRSFTFYPKKISFSPQKPQIFSFLSAIFW